MIRKRAAQLNLRTWNLKVENLKKGLKWMLDHRDRRLLRGPNSLLLLQ